MRGFATVTSTLEPQRNSGLSGFPFPFADAPATGQEGRYLISTTRRQCIQWWWSVRKWQVSGGVSGGSFGGSWTVPSPFLIDNHVNQYRLTPPASRYAVPFATGTEFAYFEPVSETGLSLNLMPPDSAIYPGLRSIVRSAPSFLPYLLIGGQLLTSVFSTDSIGGTLEAQGLDIDFCGHSLNTYSSPGTADFGGLLIIEPYSYW